MKNVNLYSVGCVLDTETGNTFPALAGGLPDTSEGVAVHLTEVEIDDWWDALSPSDRLICQIWLDGFRAGEASV